MNGFKKCNNGHFYKEDLTACPYCPGGNSSGGSNAGSGGADLGRTMVTSAGGSGSDSGKTEVFGSGNDSSDKTKVFGSGGTNQGSGQVRDLNRTYIAGVSDQESDELGGKVESAPRSTRRIVGWIISYTLDPMGVDYRIYEGTNTIGRDAKNTITLTLDPTISGEHVTILYRNGKFKIKDKMTANGTYLNGQELEVEEAYNLNDGDEVKLGGTVFKFKSCE